MENAHVVPAQEWEKHEKDPEDKLPRSKKLFFWNTKLTSH